MTAVCLTVNGDTATIEYAKRLTTCNVLCCQRNADVTIGNAGERNGGYCKEHLVQLLCGGGGG